MQVTLNGSLESRDGVFISNTFTKAVAFKNESTCFIKKEFSQNSVVTSYETVGMIVADSTNIVYYKYDCPNPISIAHNQNSIEVLFLKYTSSYGYVLGASTVDGIGFISFSFSDINNFTSIIDFNVIISGETFKSINCDDTYCIIQTNNKNYLFYADLSGQITDDSIEIGEGFCTTQQTPPLLKRVDAMECVTTSSLTVTGINSFTFNTNYQSEPLSSFYNNLFYVFDSTSVYEYVNEYQMLNSENSINGPVFAAVENYFLTNEGIFDISNDFNELSIQDPPIYNSECEIELKDIEINVTATIYKPSTYSLTNAYPSDAIAEIFIEQISGLDLDETSLSSYNFVLETSNSNTTLSSLFDSNFLKVRKDGGSYESILNTMFDIEDTSNIQGMYLHFMLNWTHSSYAVASIIDNNNYLNLEGTTISFKINNQKYIYHILSQEIATIPTTLSGWEFKTFTEYANKIGLNSITNKFLVERAVEQFWTFYQKYYDNFTESTCENDTITQTKTEYDGTCNIPSYVFTLGEEIPTTTNSFGISYCDGINDCPDRELTTISCSIIADNVYTSTLYTIAIKKKYDFMDARNCKTSYLDNTFTAHEYGECVYEHVTTLMVCEEAGNSTECSSVMFPTEDDKVSVVTTSAISDSGEDVALSSITSTSTTSNSQVSTPESLNLSTLSFSVENIMNYQTTTSSKSSKGVSSKPKHTFRKKSLKTTTGDVIELPSLTVDSQTDAYLVGDGLTVSNQEYITEDYTICVEINDYCQDTITDETFEVLYVIDGVNEESEVILLDEYETPTYLQDSSTKTCNVVDKPGTVYPVITRVTQDETVGGVSDVGKIVYIVIACVFVLVIMAVIILVVVVGIKKIKHKRNQSILDNAFMEDSLSDELL
ncbi:Uncharacterized protein QTN25_008884 [Entamoeba marina]